MTLETLTFESIVPPKHKISFLEKHLPKLYQIGVDMGLIKYENNKKYYQRKDYPNELIIKMPSLQIDPDGLRIIDISVSLKELIDNTRLENDSSRIYHLLLKYDDYIGLLDDINFEVREKSLNKKFKSWNEALPYLVDHINKSYKDEFLVESIGSNNFTLSFEVRR